MLFRSFEHDACGVGFVADIKGRKSRDIVTDAIDVLVCQEHRGATGSDPGTGDGAGILVQIPHRFFKRIGLELGFEMPRRRRYGVGQVFLPPDPEQRAACEAIFEAAVAEEGQRVLGWRDVPVNPEVIGTKARSVMPVVRQVYVARRRVIPSAFQRRLYVIRKLTENRIREQGVDPGGYFHICSLSAEVVIYKGLLTPSQLRPFYTDLEAPDMVSAIAMVHSRFSTNTFPTWDLAQPMRHIAHNGEINTLRGNRNWMQARASLLQSAKFSGPLDRLLPIIVPDGSDSAQFDNMVELLHLGGRSLPHAMMMMIPEAFENHEQMDAQRRAYYDYASTLMEPWDGPAAILFTDGHVVGATLDRNGLRPARYLITKDDRIILASETGVIDIPAENIREKGRLQPGRMLIVDTIEGCIQDDDEVKADITGRFPYRRWLDRNEFRFDQLPTVPAKPLTVEVERRRLQRAHGWTTECIDLLLRAMAAHGKEPIGSMGNDTPLAVLSDESPSLYRYFKQAFAQVTNPPIDPIREGMVMSLRTHIGGGGNPFDETPEACHRITIPSPILSNDELTTLSHVDQGVFEPLVLPMVYEAEGPDALEHALDDLCAAAADAVDEGYNILILSDRTVDARRTPIPSLLALSAVHQHLVRAGTRLLTGLVVETAEVREVHHVACLLAFGAGAVNPWLLFDTARGMATDGDLDVTPEQAVANVRAAIDKGLLKVMSKMGISTVHSYSGAQLFEILGLSREVVDQHFSDTPSRIGGLRMVDLDREARNRHARGFDVDAALNPDRLVDGGRYRWRRRGERHVWNPATISAVQQAVRGDDAVAWRRFTDLVEAPGDGYTNLRDLLEFAPREPVPLEEVEPWTDIVTRFCTGAMSFGSISAQAHETLAIAMNRIGGRSNSGEGGEESRRFKVGEDGELRRSAIKQIASGRFGVHAAYLVNADELQIKVSQGAKPGEGGQLPGHKVSERIAAVRCSTPGVTLISPPPHHDIYSIEDLAQLIYDLSVVNPEARVSVKLVSEAGVGTVAAGVAKARAGCVVIAGASGGTGASPMSSIQHCGLPWELGLAETQQVLVQNGLRDRIRVQADGGMRTGRDVVVAALLGAEEFGFATSALIALGCIMLRKCHLNTCSVGIATQDPRLEEAFTGSPDHVVRLFKFLAEDIREHMAALGVRTMDEMVGRVDLLRARTDLGHWKAETLDLANMLLPGGEPGEVHRFVKAVDRGLENHMDVGLLADAQGAIDGGAAVELSRDVQNTDRAVGAMMSGAIARRHGEQGLPDDSVVVRFTGSAGQSFGAFLARGASFHLEGDANDYLGKGLSGGRITVRPPANASFVAHENILIGNTALYGATGGEVFLNGIAGERFAVRNSGARAVVEGTGDHGCEYMTGGAVVVLGKTGRNFAAGMSGGVAYVYDVDGQFSSRVNREMVEVESLLHESDIWLVQGLIERHVQMTGSAHGQRILDNWEVLVPSFVMVMPTEYKRVLMQRRAKRRASQRQPGQEVSHG